jgi:hypothetical protein
LAFTILKLLFPFSIRFKKAKELGQGWLYKINWFKEKQKFFFAVKSKHLRFKPKFVRKNLFKLKVRKLSKLEVKLWKKVPVLLKQEYNKVRYFLGYSEMFKGKLNINMGLKKAIKKKST